MDEYVSVTSIFGRRPWIYMEAPITNDCTEVPQWSELSTAHKLDRAQASGVAALFQAHQSSFGDPFSL